MSMFILVVIIQGTRHGTKLCRIVYFYVHFSSRLQQKRKGKWGLMEKRGTRTFREQAKINSSMNLFEIMVTIFQFR